MSIFCETSFCVYCVLFLEYNFALLVCNDVCVNMKGSQGMKGCLACTNNHIYTTLLLEYSSYQHHKYDCSNYYIYSNKFPPLHGSIGTHFAKFLISNFLQGLTYSALYGVNNSSAPWMQFLVHCSLKHKALCWNQQVTFWNILTQEFHRERKLHVD